MAIRVLRIGCDTGVFDLYVMPGAEGSSAEEFFKDVLSPRYTPYKNPYVPTRGPVDKSECIAFMRCSGAKIRINPVAAEAIVLTMGQSPIVRSYVRNPRQIMTPLPNPRCAV